MLEDPSTRTTAAEPPSESAARWAQIAADLRADIAAGRFAPGAQLPNELQLALRFDVNRHTLRQAVRQLVHEGHLRVVQGRGTFVRALVLDYALKRRTRLSQNLADAGEIARRDLLDHRQSPAGEWAAALRLPPTGAVQVLHTKATVRGRPIGLSTTAYPLPRCAGMVEAFCETGSITAGLRRVGVPDYQRASSVVSCRLPSQAEADALSRAATEPVLVVQFVNVDSQGRPVEAGRTLFASDAVQLTVAHEP